jgi:hypothetical protein
MDIASEFSSALAGDLLLDASSPTFELDAKAALMEGRGVALHEKFARDDHERRSRNDAIYQLQSEIEESLRNAKLLPAGYEGPIPLDASRWLRPPLEGPLADEIKEKLDSSGWQWVCHTTKAAKLANIARLGLVDGGLLDLVEVSVGDRRPHGNFEKQELLESAVFCSFWPAWWLFTEHHFGSEDAVIILVNSASVCLQEDCAFIDQAVRRGSVDVAQLLNSRNTAEGGRAAWRSCWGKKLPLCTKEQQP